MKEELKEELTLRLLEMLTTGSATSHTAAAHIVSGYEKYLDKKIFVRTVTHHYTGHVISVDSLSLTVDSAAWIADDGRFNETVKSGDFDEVEPYPGSVTISLYAILDVTIIPKLLTEAK